MDAGTALLLSPIIHICSQTVQYTCMDAFELDFIEYWVIESTKNELTETSFETQYPYTKETTIKEHQGANFCSENQISHVNN